MKNIRNIIVAVLYILTLSCIPVVRAGATCAPYTIDDRTYGSYTGAIVHTADEGWAMRAYYGCKGSPGSAEYKLGFYSNCAFDLRWYDYSTGSPVYKKTLWRTGLYAPGCKIVFQTDGNMVIYDYLGDVVWAAGTVHSNGAKPYCMHIRLNGLTAQASIYYYNQTSTKLWHT